MFLSKIIVHGPHNVFRRLSDEAKQLIFETIGGFNLISAVYHPIVKCEAIVDWGADAYTHVVKRQKVEPVGAGIIYLVFGVVAFDSERTSPFAKIDGYAFTGGNYICAVGLENVAINLGPGFVRGVSLQSVGGLTELQIEAPAPAAAGRGIGWMLNDDAGLVKAEFIAEDIVGAQQIYSTDRVVEVVGVVAVERHVDGGVTEKTEHLAVIGLQNRLNCFLFCSWL